MAWRLTPKPLVPVLVQVAALAGAPAGCGDDEGGSSTSNTTDVFPTTVCAHQPDAPECGSTGMSSDSSTSEGTSTSGTTDIFPTAGPCVHDPNAPECASTGAQPSTSSSGGDTDGTGSSTGATGSTSS